VIQWDLALPYQTCPFPIHDPTSRCKPGYILLFVEETWDTLLSLIGAHNVPGLPRIFRNAKFCTWSAERLLEIIQKALAGKYCPQNYSELELDLSAAIYELGGGAALHALHNSPFAFPPRTTLLGRRRDFRLQISVSSAMMVDLLANIKTMFKDIKPGHKKVGITLSMDEIASDTAVLSHRNWPHRGPM
jgi:hypothetical protein